MLSHVLLVGTNTTYTTLLRYRLEPTLSVELEQVDTGSEALNAINKTTTLVVVTDALDDGSGIDLVDALRAGWPDVPVLLMTPPDTPNLARQALAAGVTDVVISGRTDLDRMEWWIRQARHDAAPVPPSDVPPSSPALIGNSIAIRRTRSRLRRAQQTDAPVLISAEAGLAPETWARHVHRESLRADAPFVDFDGAVLSEQAIADALFGTPSTPGACARAAGGTLFIDNVSLLPAAIQQALYTMADTGTIPAHADRNAAPFTARLVLGTGRAPDALTEDATFCSALYRLVAPHTVRVPALRDRTDDLLALAKHLLRTETQSAEHGPFLFSVAAMQRLVDYDWPGNYRELEDAIRRGVRAATGLELTVPDLFSDVALEAAPSEADTDTAPAHADPEAPSGDTAAAADPTPPAASPTAERAPAPRAPESGPAHAGSPAPRSLFDLQAFSMSPVQAPPAAPDKTATKTMLERVAAQAPDAIVPMDELHVLAVEHALHVCDGDIKQAARALGVSAATVSHVAGQLVSRVAAAS